MAELPLSTAGWFLRIDNRSSEIAFFRDRQYLNIGQAQLGFTTNHNQGENEYERTN